jgi:plastocyanin
VFKPETIEVKPGTKVVWTNEGRNNHDIVPVAANGNWGVALEEFGADAVYSHTFTEPGVYDYYCTVHGTKTRGMIGKVVVTE